jgi:hypothetical protein
MCVLIPISPSVRQLKVRDPNTDRMQPMKLDVRKCWQLQGLPLQIKPRTNFVICQKNPNFNPWPFEKFYEMDAGGYWNS